MYVSSFRSYPSNYFLFPFNRIEFVCVCDDKMGTKSTRYVFITTETNTHPPQINNTRTKGEAAVGKTINFPSFQFTIGWRRRRTYMYYVYA